MFSVITALDMKLSDINGVTFLFLSEDMPAAFRAAILLSMSDTLE